MTPPDHSARFEDLLPAYALGALDGDELRELEGHLAAGCPECDRQLAAWSRDLEALAASVPAVAPSGRVRQRVLGAVQRPKRGVWVPRWALIPAAALLLLAVAGSIGGWFQRDDARRLAAERDRMAARASALERELDRTREEAARLAGAVRFMADPGVAAIQLAGLGPTPGARGRAFVDRERGEALFHAAGLPALEPGETYQLWRIASGTPVSAGTFEVEAGGRASLPVEGIGSEEEIQAWAVTVEPRGGVPQPTGPMVLKS